MKTTIYREPNRFKRWYASQFFQFESNGEERNFLRIRWWVPLGFPTIWLGHNLLLVFWYMISAIAGRTVSFDASGWWYAPLRFVFEHI